GISRAAISSTQSSSNPQNRIVIASALKVAKMKNKSQGVLRVVRGVAAALALVCAAAGAAPLEAWSINIEPWGYEHNGEGIAPRFLRYLSDSAAVPLALSVRPYLRATEGLRSGQNAITMTIPTPERERFAIAVCQPASIHISILYRREIVGESAR